MARRGEPPIETDPAAFWLAAYEQAVRDAAMARAEAPSVLPKLLSLQREAWREYKAATDGKDDTDAADTSLEAQLAKVQRLLTAAEAKGSMVAAGKLLTQQGEIAEKIKQRDLSEAEAKRHHLDEDALMDALVAKAGSLPEKVKRRLREALREPS